MAGSAHRNVVGVFSQVGDAPRFYSLMTAMVPAAFAASTVGSVRVILAAQSGGATTVGSAALASSLGGVATGVLAGALVDRFRPHLVLAMSLAGLMVSYCALAVLTRQAMVTSQEVVLFAALDGALIAVSFMGLVKVQSALVRPDARGAAESINSIRASVGSLLGALLAESIVVVADRVIFCALLMAASTVLVFVIPRRLLREQESGLRPKGSLATLVHAVRRNGSFRTVVIADLVMYLVLPSTVLSLAVVREGLLAVQGPLVASGIVGVLAGRLAMAARGTRGRVSRDLTLATSGYALIALVGAVAMSGGWLFSNAAFLGALVLVGSACGSFTQTMLGAKFQEQVPDAARGQASGAMYAARGVLLSLGIIVTTTLVSAWSTQLYAGFLACALLLVVMLLQGFRRIS